MRVLIVEDEPLLADAIRDGLRLEAIAAEAEALGAEILKRHLAITGETFPVDEKFTLGVAQHGDRLRDAQAEDQLHDVFAQHGAPRVRLASMVVDRWAGRKP